MIIYLSDSNETIFPSWLVWLTSTAKRWLNIGMVISIVCLRFYSLEWYLFAEMRLSQLQQQHRLTCNEYVKQLQNKYAVRL